VFFNLFGYGIPLFAAVFTIPIIIHKLGTDRFGILTLAWVLIGYLGLFDMGLGRALTKLVSEKLGSGLIDEIPTLIWTALAVMAGIGIFVAIAAALSVPVLSREILKIPPELRKESTTAFMILVLFTPVIITSVGFRGVLDAYQRFDLTNTVRIPLGLFTFIAPLMVIPFSVSLVPLFVVLMGGRMVALLVQGYFCLRVVPNLKNRIRIDPTNIGALLRFGGWMTVTNIISPLMIYADRFFIGAVISVTAVAYYATPGEVITKLLLISGSLMGVLFPAFSSTYDNDRPKTTALFLKGIKYIYLIMFPVSLVIVTFSGEGLSFWLGTEFARQSTLILQLMTIAVFFISLGQVPYSLIQGAGRPDITARLHLIELPVYLMVLYLLIRGFGIRGAAFAWMLRAMIDSTLLYFLARRLLKPALPSTRLDRFSAIPIVLCLLAAGFSFVHMAVTVKLVGVFCFLAIYTGAGWIWFLNASEKDMIKNTVRPFFTSRS